MGIQKLKPDQHKQIEFIKDCLRKGEERKVILQKFAKNFNTGKSVRTFDERLKLANKAIQAEQAKIIEQAEKGIQTEIEALKSKIMTPIERQTILADSIRDFEDKLAGRKPFTFFQGQKIVNSHNGGVFMLPIDTQTAVKKVIRELMAELNKMGGDYAPQKTDISINKAGLDAVKEKYE